QFFGKSGFAGPFELSPASRPFAQRWKTFAWIHLPMVGTGAASEGSDRRKHNRSAQACSFFHERPPGGLASLGALSEFLHGQPRTRRRCLAGRKPLYRLNAMVLRPTGARVCSGGKD